MWWVRGQWCTSTSPRGAASPTLATVAGALRIRSAVAQDAALAAEIYMVSSNAAWGAWQGPKELTEERIARWAADSVRPRYHWWVAHLDSAPVGLAGIGRPGIR